MSSQIEDSGFKFIVIDELPDYWRMKIRGWGFRPRPRCPWDGGALAKGDQPVDHVQCLKCGRNYV